MNRDGPGNNERREDIVSRNIKIFKMALLAAFALSAVASVSSAEAKEDFFFFSQEPSVVTGASEGVAVFTVDAGKIKVECAISTLAGTVNNKKAMEVTLHPTFFECNIGVFGVGTIDTKECNFIFSGRTDNNEDATVELECAAGSKLKITNASCNLTFGPQAKKGATYTNGVENGRKDVTIKMTLSGLHYELENAKPLGCAGFGGAGEAEDGTFNAAYTATAYEDFGGPVEEDKFTEGNVIDWWVE